MPRFFRALVVVGLTLGLCSGREVSAQLAPIFGGEEEIAFERVIREALRRPVTLRFQEAPLWEVMAAIEVQIRIPIVIDTRALEDAGLALDVPVTIDCERLDARQALDSVLGSLDLARVGTHSLVITTREKADEELVMRVYPVADLIAGGDGDTQGLWYQQLIELISSTVAAETWDTVGGQGAIRPVFAASAIVVTQTREVHEGVEDLLYAIRSARQAQGFPTRAAVDLMALDGQVDPAPQRAPVSERHDLPPSQESAEVRPALVHSWQRPRRHE